MRRIMMLLLASWLFAMSFTGCAGQEKYKKEPNTGLYAESYPYLIKTTSARWYLSTDDIELLGEEAYYDGLYAILKDAELDFADAREALKDYTYSEIPPVDIFTDFCGKAGIKEEKSLGAYYNAVSNFIKLFDGWDIVRASLLHEYVHYLTCHCADPASQFGFWTEGAAEYISLFECKNRLSRSVNMGLDISTLQPVIIEQTWNEEDKCLEPKLLYLGFAEMFIRGYAIGSTYYAVKNRRIERTAQMQEEPNAEDLSFCEAASMYAYLIETYGKETVYKNWNMDTEHMETVYGKAFPDIYREWAVWNAEQCKLLGINIDAQ
ncbi:MAG: hypothetical protein IKF49_08480 [Clostridia bacterium]|nr:hypothetical protein [Clostridia bacterium]